jgi:hypothetical protein
LRQEVRSLGDYIIRFIIGGIVISFFAVIGDMLKPKSFAGLFGASPAVALTTLAMAFAKQGGGYVSTEGRSMIVGAVAMFFYCQVTAWLLMRYKLNSLATTAAAIVLWFGVAFGLWAVYLKGA